LGYRNRAPVSIQAHGRAIDRPSCNEGVKFVCCLRAALILQALIVATKLTTLGRVNSPQANARPVNFERVAVNDAGLPGEIIRERWRGAKACRREEQSGERDTSECHSIFHFV